jgi:hypothetical protein
MKQTLRIASITVTILAATLAIPGARASATTANSRDCKLYGFCDQGRDSGTLSDVIRQPSLDPGQTDWDSRGCRRFGVCPGPVGR